MGWIKGLFKSKTEEKLNPGQRLIGMREGSEIYSRENVLNYRKQYEELEIVNRGVNMIVDDVSDIQIEVGNKKVTPVAAGIRQTTVNKLLNYEPNPFQDASTFRRNLIIDYIIDGNAFIYFDGSYLYHLPANKVTIHSDSKTFVQKYEFEGMIDYYPDEIIHIKDNSFYSIYRGISRLRAARGTMELLQKMRSFQHNFFRNGAVPGLVLKSPDVLSDKVKERMLERWKQRYRPDTGGRNPLILDGGLELESLNNINFKELDFQSACDVCEKTILKSIGIPPILFDGGNNANIAPNHRLYYLETILPIVKKFNSAYTRFFGYEIKEDTTNTPALQPALKELASYLTGLVNGGVITPNEARDKLGKEALEGCDEIRIPANIAGSAGNPAEGGRPEGDKDD